MSPTPESKKPAKEAEAKAPAAAPAPAPAAAADSGEGRTARIPFSGNVLTAEDGQLRVPAESRKLCALFDTGLWLVSESYKNSPFVTSVAAQARRQGFKVNEPNYVTPDVI